MSWSELDDGAPITGDGDLVRRVADEFAEVGDEAETLTRRLRSLGDSSGPTIWRGEAADVFRRLLAETAPDLVALSTNHDAGAAALRRYATSLEDAQDDARRALDDGARAKTDKDDAEARHDRARSEGDGAASAARSAEFNLRTAQAQRLLAVDPTYQSQLLQYEAGVRAQRDQARSHEADARRRQSAAQSDADGAGVRFAAAKRLAGQAAQLRDSAARIAARELDDAGDAAVDRRSVFRRMWDGAVHTVHTIDNALDRITASPEFASWMNIISDAGDVLGAAATVMAFVPGLQPAAGALLIAAAAFKGVAFAGTWLAYAHGNASGGQVLGRGLDFGMALLPMGKAGKLLAKSRAARPDTLAGSVKRFIWYDDARHAKGYLQTVHAADKVGKGLVLDGVNKVGKVVHVVTPKNYFRAKTTITLTKDVIKGYQGLANGGRQLGKDIAHFEDPIGQDSYAEKAPDAAKESIGHLIDQVGETTHKEGVAKGINFVAKPLVKKGMERIAE